MDAEKNPSLRDYDFQNKMQKNDLELFSSVVTVSNHLGMQSISQRNFRFLELVEMVKNRTMLPIKRLYDLYLSVNYINQWEIPGAIVEVGTWKCGALGLALMADETKKRKIYGFDTFAGHLPPPPDEFDIRGGNMLERYLKEVELNNHWAGSIDVIECRKFLSGLDSGSERTQLIKGDVRDTLPLFQKDQKFEQIALLRIDVDWYRESKLALENLYPLLSKSGVLIMDDYGHHSGQRKAVDEYFVDKKIKFSHIDYSCISAIKQ